MAARERMGSNIDAGIVARVAAGLRGAVSGWQQAWFGPMDPLPPVVAPEQQPSVAGRQFDYPVGFNTRITPRAEEAVSFWQMRALAEPSAGGYDLLRLIIETRKDQICSQQWTVKPRDKSKKPDDRCAKIQDFLQLPDRENNWDIWLRMLLEDLFVIDAVTIYPRHTLGGDLYALEPIDGSTIKRVIDDGGRTPIPPLPAYQQILKGVPAIDYTREELIYAPRNRRTNKFYGFSPVEQIIMTVNIALRRQLWQLNYYTEGTIPDAFASVPKEWNPDQIKQFAQYWDSLYENNPGERRKMKFVPDAKAVQQTKEPVLKDEYDEWLARVCCFAFSVEPTPFIKQLNRSTAETSREQAMQEGRKPIEDWVCGVMNRIIAQCFGAPDLVFDWNFEESINPVDQAQIDDLDIRNGSLTVDERRRRRGDDPYGGELGDVPLILTGSGPVRLEDAIKEPEPPPAMGADGSPIDNGDDLQQAGQQDKAPPKPEEKTKAAPGGAVLKAKKPIAPEDKPAVAKNIGELKQSLTDFFAYQAPKVAAQLSESIGDPGQQGETRRTKDTDAILTDLNLDEWSNGIPERAEPYLAAVAVDAGGDALKDLGVTSADADALMRERAVEWSKDRAAEMVGKKWVDGELVDNPDATWIITDGTRDMLRATTEQALDEGWSAQKFSDAILENHAFSEARADMIARTELAFADVAGNAQGWKASGMVKAMQFVAAPDCCDECEEMDGQIFDLDDLDSAAPIHPYDRCNMVAVLDDEPENED